MRGSGTGGWLRALVALTALASTSAAQEPKPPAKDGPFGTGSPTFAARRSAKARPPGTTEAGEKAVLEGLLWLLRHQEPDGSWSARALAARGCGTDEPCLAPEAAGSMASDESLTSLALLAFFARGESIASKVELEDPVTGEKHALGPALEPALRWLVGRQGTDGALPAADAEGPFYDDALVALALAEAYGLSLDKTLREPAQRALDHLVALQKAIPRMGWKYADEAKVADPSATAWAVLALRAGQVGGLRVPEAVLPDALACSQVRAGPDERASPLAPPLHAFVRAFAGGDVADPFLARTAAALAKSRPGLEPDYFGWHVATLALAQYDGPGSPRPDAGAVWKPWNERVLALLVEGQDRSKACRRGAWLAPDAWSARAGRALYATALNVLTLETVYRYPNEFQARARRASAGR